MKKIPGYLAFLIMIVVFTVSSCKKHAGSTCVNTFDIVLNSPYSDPIWHPSGKVIGFNHTPLKSIEYTTSDDCPYSANYVYQTDSTGFWLINADGTNQRRVLPYKLVTPAWSADGKWLAFANGGDIFKMPFDGQKLDTNAIVRLTFNGNNYSPSWNYLSNKFVYIKTICNGENSCGVRLFDETNAASPDQFLFKYGASTAWFHHFDSFLFYTSQFTGKGNMIGDSLWVYTLNTHQKQLLTVITTPYEDNRIFQTSPDDSKIAFTCEANLSNWGIQICTINNDGSNFTQLTTDDALGFTWGPDGRIVYESFDYRTLDQSHGVLWIMNSDGSNKTQLTYNRYSIKQP